MIILSDYIDIKVKFCADDDKYTDENEIIESEYKCKKECK